MFESVVCSDDEKTHPDHDGGLAVPMLQDQPRLNKPPMIYWVQAASAATLTGGNPKHDAIWMYRVPSVLAAIGVALLTWHLGRRMYTDLVGVIGGWIIAVAPVFAWEATQARADMVLVCFTLATMAMLWRIVERTMRQSTPASKPPAHRSVLWCPPDVAAMWVCVALGILTKGPITPMVVVLAVVSLAIMDRRMNIVRATKPLHGVAIIVLFLVPWVAMVSRQYGLDKYVDLVLHETVGRSATSREGHWGPPGYHTLLQTVLMWPGSLVTYLSVWWFYRLARPTKAGGDGSDLRARFLLAWVVPSWVVFECVATKLPHYTMPMYPALAIISARGIFAAAGGSLGNMLRPVRVTAVVVWFVIGCGVVGVPFALMSMRTAEFIGSDESALWISCFLLIGCMLGIAAVMFGAVAWFQRRFVRTLLVTLCVMTVTMPLLTSLVLPTVMGLSTDLGEMIDELDPSGSRPVAGVGYHEDSMVFLTRGRYERISGDAMFDWMASHEDGVLVMRIDFAEPQRITQVQEHMWFGSGTVGFNYTNGEELCVLVFQHDPGFFERRLEMLKRESSDQP